jgi:hypothetical protein
LVHYHNRLDGFFDDRLVFIKWVLAFSPIAMVLFLMVFRNWGGGRAGAAGWFTALLAAALSFGAHPELIAYSQMKGVSPLPECPLYYLGGLAVIPCGQ